MKSRLSWRTSWRVAIASLTLVTAVGLTAAEPATAGLVPTARPTGIIASPAELDGVFCTAPANCWSVGNRQLVNGADLNQVLHWTGRTWFTVAVSSPGGTKPDSESRLNAVRCTSARDCWAVGTYQKSGAPAGLSQAQHWNGKKWSLMPTPNPNLARTPSGYFNELTDVACTSASSCWAVGFDGAFDGSTETQRNEALHWNGKSWLQVKTPNPAGTGKGDGNGLDSIRCPSPSDCWAAGADGGIGSSSAQSISNELLRWTGKKWVTADAPNPGGTKPGQGDELFGLACTSPASCWAAGFRSIAAPGRDTVLVNELLRWNGKAWRSAKVPDPDGTGPGAVNVLTSVNCSSSKDCWAVGQTGGTGGQPALNQALHWNGRSWSAISTPEPAGQGTGSRNDLNSIRCTSAANCWAVGSTEDVPPTGPATGLNQALHWTGKKWFADSSAIMPVAAARQRREMG